MGNDDDKRKRPEVLPPGGGSAAEDAVLSGATVMRVEHDAMLAVSIQRKRDEDQILEEALAELERAPYQAAGNYYVIEYDSGDRIEGGSVNLARSLARRWGNCSVRAYVASEDDERVHINGVFLDLQTNYRIETPWVVSKTVWRRKGGLQKLRDDHLMVAVRAGASKAMRNAIFDGLPKYLVQSVNERARVIAARVAREGAQSGELLRRLMMYGVTLEMIVRRFGVHPEKMTDDQLADLLAIGNKLRDRESSLADEFEKPPRSASDVDALERGDGNDPFDAAPAGKAASASEVLSGLGKTEVTAGRDGAPREAEATAPGASGPPEPTPPATPPPKREEPKTPAAAPTQGSLGEGWAP